MSKGLLGGMTDYSNQSFTDILQDLLDEQKNVTVFIEIIEKNITTLKDNNYWNKKVISSFQAIIGFSIQHYKTTKQELTEIVNEMQIEVKEHHCKRLNKISAVAHQINIDIGLNWNRDYEEYGNKEYGDPNFQIVENIYADTRDMAVNLLDISNIANRLKDFIGKQSQPKAIIKKNFKLELSHKIGLGALSVAIIVMLFGNNICGRLKIKNVSYQKTDTAKILVQQSIGAQSPNIEGSKNVNVRFGKEIIPSEKVKAQKSNIDTLAQLNKIMKSAAKTQKSSGIQSPNVSGADSMVISY